MIAKELTSRGLSILFVMALVLAVIPPHVTRAVSVRYATPDGLTSGSCNDWASACTLQFALSIDGWEIWVAAGTHLPATEEKDRRITFQLKNGVAVYGGFAMTETERIQRNPAINVSILSGDIGVVGDSSDNSYHVVTGATGAILDGVTITAGNANGASPNDRGGGMYNSSSNPALTNVIFISNTATTGGGGMANESGSPILTNVTFSGNSAGWYGGGMANWSGSGPALTNVTFSGNAAGEGGGMYNYYNNSSPTLTSVAFDSNSATLGGGMYSENSSGPALMNVTFTGNTASSQGGGMYNGATSPTLMNVTFSANAADSGGGMGNQAGSSPVLTNVTFISNTASTQGGGMYNYSGSSKLTNATFTGNTADLFGGGMANLSNASPAIRNTIFWDNAAPNGAQIYNNVSAPIVSDSVIQGGCPAGSNCTTIIITTTPQLGTLGDYGGATRTIPLLSGSSAIDATSSNCPTADQRGVIRSSPICDIGAYEVQTILVAVPGGQTSGPCETWANACELRYALTSAVSGKEIWAAVGTYKPTTDTNRAATFQLKDGVALYGGFAGTETARTQRNPAANVTILSGDIGVAGDSNDNSCHVVRGATGATMDGFTITAGNASNCAYPDDFGGGMLNQTSSPTLTTVTFSGNAARYGGGMYNNYSSPTLANVTFSGNSATDGDGGGMLNYESSPMLTNVTFSGNTAAYGGGGMRNSFSSPTLTNVTFANNSAAYDGGGMWNWNSSPTLANLTFSGNSTTGKGGGMYNVQWSSPALTNVSFISNSAAYGGGMGNVIDSSPALSNVTFSGNTATDRGGGIYDLNSSNPTLANATFNGNSAQFGGGIYNQNTSISTINNTILWGNTATIAGAQIHSSLDSIPIVSDSVIQGGYAGGTNIIADDPNLGTLGNYGGATPTIPLLPGSSAIDTGNDAACPATDQRGIIRPQGARCDIGAFEKQVYSVYLPLVVRF
jgi:parallel beta-helix repeat protein